MRSSALPLVRAVLARVLLPTAAIGVLVACGGSSDHSGDFTASGSSSVSETGTLSGSVNGTTFTVASVIGGLQVATETATCASTEDGGQTCTTASSGQTLGILLTNRADSTCAFVQEQAASGNGVFLGNYDVLQLTVTNSAGNVTPGTYPLANDTGVATNTSASAQLTTTDGQCNDNDFFYASDGTITLTQVSAETISGTYAVTSLYPPGSLTGSFTTGVCYLAPDAGRAGGDGGPPACE